MAAAKKATKDANFFESFTKFGPEAFSGGYEKFAENLNTVSEFQKESFDAFVVSAEAYTKGFEKLAGAQAEFAKASFEDGVAVAKQVSSTKSVQEAFELNSEFARDAIEKNVGQFNKVADLCIDTTKETVAPLSERYTDLVEKIQAYRP